MSLSLSFRTKNHVNHNAGLITPLLEARLYFCIFYINFKIIWRLPDCESRVSTYESGRVFWSIDTGSPPILCSPGWCLNSKETYGNIENFHIIVMNWKSARRWALDWSSAGSPSFLPCLSSILDCKTLQTAIIRRFQLRERQYTTFQVKRCLFWSY